MKWLGHMTLHSAPSQQQHKNKTKLRHMMLHYIPAVMQLCILSACPYVPDAFEAHFNGHPVGGGGGGGGVTDTTSGSGKTKQGSEEYTVMSEWVSVC
jgi:hypothetical protein